MSVLSEQEIEDLTKKHPKKKILRILFLILGLGLITTGMIFLSTGFDFGVKIGDVNISFVFHILIIILGLILGSKYFIAPYYLRENSITKGSLRNLREPVESFTKFTSIAFTRLIAAIILIISGSISLFVYGTDFGHEVEFGSAIFLGGPSFFYVTGLPMLGIGFGLLIYFFLSIFRGTFSRSPNFYFFYEIRTGFPWLTEVPRNKIEAIRYQNNHLGPKLGWIVIFMPFIILQLMTAIPLFQAERASPEFIFSWTMLIISILDIIAMLILVFFQQNYFEMASEEMLYEMWLAPSRRRRRSQFKEEFSNILDIGVEELSTLELKNKNQESSGLFSNINTTHFQLFNMVFGLFLIISSVIMMTYMVLFGPLVWWIAIIYGLILIVKSVSHDFSLRSPDRFYYDQFNRRFKFRRTFLYKFHYVSAFNVEDIHVKKWLRKLDLFDILGTCGILLFLIVQQVQGWFVANSTVLIYDNLVSTIYMMVVIIFILLYLCLPVNVIEFKTSTITYRIRITLKKKKSNNLSEYISNLRNTPKELKKQEMRRVFYLRLGVIGGLALGTLIYMVLYFIFVF